MNHSGEPWCRACQKFEEIDIKIPSRFFLSYIGEKRFKKILDVPNSYSNRNDIINVQNKIQTFRKRVNRVLTLLLAVAKSENLIDITSRTSGTQQQILKSTRKALQL